MLGDIVRRPVHLVSSGAGGLRGLPVAGAQVEFRRAVFDVRVFRVSIRLWFPRYVREDASDYDYLSALSPADRAWHDAWRDEYHSAAPRGISTPEHIAESGRAKQRLRTDLYTSGLRSEGSMDDSIALPAPAPDHGLDSPEAKDLLRQLRAMRPDFDPKDGRKPPRFRSKLVEKRFTQLARKLKELLG